MHPNPVNERQVAGALTEAAPAKINLALHVTGQRADGYHLLDSLVAFTTVGDVVHLAPGPLQLTVSGPFANPELEGPDNLCLRAARLVGADVSIILEKHLPVASGIGGGSADAAAVLRGLARMGLALSENPQVLGADVPVCIASRPSRMQGIGEILTPLAPLPPLHLVLVNPGVGVSTPHVFRNLLRRDNPGLPEIPNFANARALIDWLETTRNDLEAPAMQVAPVIAEVLDALCARGAGFQRMSGSGATCFGLFDTASSASAAADALSRNGWWAVATELAPAPSPR